MNEAKSVLAPIQTADNVLGCAVATRDGLPSTFCFNQAHDPESLSAMAAATLAAGETALLGIDENVERVIVQGAKTRTVIEGINDQHLLIIVASSRLPVDELIAHAQQAKKGLLILHAS